MRRVTSVLCFCTVVASVGIMIYGYRKYRYSQKLREELEVKNSIERSLLSVKSTYERFKICYEESVLRGDKCAGDWRAFANSVAESYNQHLDKLTDEVWRGVRPVYLEKLLIL